ncbi:MAG: tRNA (adenosine(37)-N6)-threonylcarbamoyltransferase complex dimerization subunit type 1 TsaB [Candidatus Aminicenantes bacterium]|nr:tRNA (adenosine(37)-N6)-threonylcarbamoyltransferase complex dimerization subunit type 1 TsaB [Candidatus Aminicenantes bacterium]
MILLAVDTTTPAGSVALLENKHLRAEINVESSLNFSERLLPSVDFLLKTSKIPAENITGFALAVGPGSFTGIRVGISTVLSFSFASGKQVAPVSALEALALKIKDPYHRLLCPMIDAKKGEIYTCLYEVKGGRFVELFPPGATTPDFFISSLPRRRTIHFIGSGTRVYGEKIRDYMGDKARFSRRSLFVAHEVGLLGYELFSQGKAVSMEKVKPLYYRKSQAEE